MNVSEQVRDALRATGLSLYEIEQRTGVAAAILSRFLRGERGITLDTLDKLSSGEHPVLRIPTIAPRFRRPPET